jgi:iron(III) transport system substrate-binding protein
MTRTVFALTRWAALLAVIILFSQCKPGTSSNGQAAPFTTPDKVITVYHHSYLVPDEPIYQDFEKNTEYDIQVTPLSGQEILAQAQAGELAGGDFVVVEDLYQAHQLRKAGVIEPFSVGIFGHEIPSRYVDSEGYWGAMTRWTMGVVFNQEKVGYDVMKRYAGLISPDLLGRVVMAHPDSSGLVTFAATMLAAYGEVPTRAYLEALAGNLAYAPRGSDEDQIMAVANGTADVAFVNTSAYLRFKYSGDPAVFKATENLGVENPMDAQNNNFYNITPVCVLKNAPERRYALSLIDFLFLKHHQTPYAEARMEYPNNVYSAMSGFLIDIEGVPQGVFLPEMAEAELDNARQLIREVFAL